ncbi:Dot/Icm secretion system substrate [Legionella steigerwaltii]|uniref:Dot/Icm T4SS effector n=1 Tax=Legionella steigerwaltii TaxID=460 RepID=A0A378LF07_9GAMM|nr:hypothetical protein [Legionella steigerwaltii]KTD77483.1 Dot/Icm T4SS effector [Legionella steigerwaltii]STY22661.1 Dot/Icm secretion system substrate [Legionella steigerwaltii]
MTLRILSFDFDGCLFNGAYIDAPYTNWNKHLTDAVIVHNRAFLDQLKSENEQYSQVIALIGSNRQSYDADFGNAGNAIHFKGSCASAIQTVCDYLGVSFNPLLLTDLYNSLEPGSAYKLIMEEIKNNKWIEGGSFEHPNCPMDETKVALIFAQMQAAATAHPDEEIIFDFYDDRLDILGRLQEFYQTNPHMIPPKVTLRLNNYDGSQITLKAALAGKPEGVIFNNYSETVVKLLDTRFWEYNQIAEELKLEMQQPVMQGDLVAQPEQFDSANANANAVEEGEKEANYESQIAIDTQPMFLQPAETLEDEVALEKEEPLPLEEQKQAVAIAAPAAPVVAAVPVAAPVAAPVIEEKASRVTEVTAASNPGRNRHGFHNQASHATNRAPIPAKYFQDSCGFSSPTSGSSCILS